MLLSIFILEKIFGLFSDNTLNNVLIYLGGISQMSNMVLRMYYPLSKDYDGPSHSNFLVSRWPKDLKVISFQNKLSELYPNCINLCLFFAQQPSFTLF